MISPDGAAWILGRDSARAGKAIDEALKSFEGLSADEVRKLRRDKFLAIGRSL